MMNRYLASATVVLWLLIASSGVASIERPSSVTLVVGDIQGVPGAKVEVPIEARAAQQLGALQMELVYDPGILEPVSVEPGSMSADLTVDHHVAIPGRLRIVMNASARESVSGDGTLLKAVFNVKGTSGQRCDLALAEVQAWDNTRPDLPPYEMLVSVEPGGFTVTRDVAERAYAAESTDPGEAVDTSWMMILGIAGGVLLLLMVAFALGKSRRKS
jgi:hypothetical protein